MSDKILPIIKTSLGSSGYRSPDEMFSIICCENQLHFAEFDHSIGFLTNCTQSDLRKVFDGFTLPGRDYLTKTDFSKLFPVSLTNPVPILKKAICEYILDIHQGSFDSAVKSMCSKMDISSHISLDNISIIPTFSIIDPRSDIECNKENGLTLYDLKPALEKIRLDIMQESRVINRRDVPHWTFYCPFGYSDSVILELFRELDKDNDQIISRSDFDKIESLHHFEHSEVVVKSKTIEKDILLNVDDKSTTNETAFDPIREIFSKIEDLWVECGIIIDSQKSSVRQILELTNKLLDDLQSKKNELQEYFTKLYKNIENLSNELGIPMDTSFIEGINLSNRISNAEMMRNGLYQKLSTVKFKLNDSIKKLLSLYDELDVDSDSLSRKEAEELKYQPLYIGLKRAEELISQASSEKRDRTSKIQLKIDRCMSLRSLLGVDEKYKLFLTQNKQLLWDKVGCKLSINGDQLDNLLATEWLLNGLETYESHLLDKIPDIKIKINQATSRINQLVSLMDISEMEVPKWIPSYTSKTIDDLVSTCITMGSVKHSLKFMLDECVKVLDILEANWRDIIQELLDRGLKLQKEWDLLGLTQNQRIEEGWNVFENYCQSRPTDANKWLDKKESEVKDEIKKRQQYIETVFNHFTFIQPCEIDGGLETNCKLNTCTSTVSNEEQQKILDSLDYSSPSSFPLFIWFIHSVNNLSTQLNSICVYRRKKLRDNIDKITRIAKEANIAIDLDVYPWLSVNVADDMIVKPSTLKDAKDLIISMLKKWVGIKIEILETLWKKLDMVSERESFYNVYNLNTLYSEEGVEILNHEIFQLEKSSNIIVFIHKRRDFLNEMQEFEVTASDPKRLYRNSQQLLQEEKFRKHAYPTLIKYEKEIIDALSDWESDQGSDFTYKGTPYLHELLNEIQTRSFDVKLFGVSVKPGEQMKTKLRPGDIIYGNEYRRPSTSSQRRPSKSLSTASSENKPAESETRPSKSHYKTDDLLPPKSDSSKFNNSKPKDTEPKSISESKISKIHNIHRKSK